MRNIGPFPTVTPTLAQRLDRAIMAGIDPTALRPRDEWIPTVDRPAPPSPQQFRCTVLVPRQDNDGAAFKGRDWEWLEAHFVAAFGAFTRPMNVEGSWRDEATGTVYHDSSRVYQVVTADRATFRQIAIQAKARFRQLAIMTTYEPISAEFV